MIDKETEKLAVQLAKQLLSKDLQKAIQINHLAGSVKSQIFDGMPKGHGAGNSSENMMIAVADARQMIRDVAKALNNLEGDQFVALQEHYLHNQSAVKIANRLMVSRASVYRIIDKALNTFIYCYRDGQFIDDALNERANDKQPA